MEWGKKYSSKEYSMLEQSRGVQKVATKPDDEVVKLESLAEMTGFPVELIKKELFNGEIETDQISMGTTGGRSCLTT